jgi:ABC-type transport system involved in multi-copper enzyme maturation permease subunit
MSSSAQIAAGTPAPISSPANQATFAGLMRGEFLKVRRLFWGMVSLLTAGFVFAFLFGASAPKGKADLQQAPLHFTYGAVESNLVVFRILVGVLLIVLTSFVIGREYQYGTIRILIGRGVGRVQLLLAKLALLGVVALGLLVAFTLLTAVLSCLLMLALVGNLDALSTITPAFWSHMGIAELTVIISMGATILMAAAMNSLGRSLTFGLSAALLFFTADNLGILVMNVLARLTQSDFWSNATAYFLGPLLNHLPDYVLPTEAQTPLQSFGPPPLVPVSGAHALWVIGAYSLVFFLLALVPTWRWDVQE